MAGRRVGKLAEPSAGQDSQDGALSPRERRRRRGREERLTVTFGRHLRAKLHEMALDAGVRDSQLVYALVREALVARRRSGLTPGGEDG